MSRGFGRQRSVFVFTVLLCLIFAGSLVAKDTAKIQFNKEKHDFGKVEQGKVLTYAFKFKNIGSAPPVDVQPRLSKAKNSIQEKKGRSRSPLIRRDMGAMSPNTSMSIQTIPPLLKSS